MAIFGLCHYCMRWRTYIQNNFVKKVKRKRLLRRRKRRWEDNITVDMERNALNGYHQFSAGQMNRLAKIRFSKQKNFLEHLCDTCPRRHTSMKLPHLQPRPRRLKLRLKRDIAKCGNWPGGQVLLAVNARILLPRECKDSRATVSIVVWDVVFSLNSPATIQSRVI